MFSDQAEYSEHMKIRNLARDKICPEKKREQQELSVSRVSLPGMKIMDSWGWVQGAGLGKYKQGRLYPVRHRDLIGTRGLGYRRTVFGNQGNSKFSLSQL